MPADTPSKTSPVHGSTYPPFDQRARIAKLKNLTCVNNSKIIARALDIGLDALEADPRLLLGDASAPKQEGWE